MITVRPVNDPPIAAPDTATVDEGGMLSIGVLDNDTDAESDTLRITAVGDALSGTVSPDGTTITYTHDGSETNTGSFTYTVGDGTDADTAMVTITVTPVNDPPIAVADTAEVDEGHTLSVEASALLANDTDAENDTLSITTVGNAVNGTVSLDGTTITYTHDGSETTTGSFSYTVSDGTDTDMTVVTIAVMPVGDAPAAAGERTPVTTATPAVAATASPTPGLVATPPTSPTTTPAAPAPPADDSGMNVGLVVLIIVVAVAIASGGAAVVVRRGRNRK